MRKRYPYAIIRIGLMFYSELTNLPTFLPIAGKGRTRRYGFYQTNPISAPALSAARCAISPAPRQETASHPACFYQTNPISASARP